MCVKNDLKKFYLTIIFSRKAPTSKTNKNLVRMVRLNKQNTSTENAAAADTQSIKKSSGKQGATKSAAARETKEEGGGDSQTTVEKKSKGKKSNADANLATTTTTTTTTIDASSSSAATSDEAPAVALRAPRTKSSKQKKAAVDLQEAAVTESGDGGEIVITSSAADVALASGGGGGEEIALLLSPLATSIQRMNAFSSTLVEMVGQITALKNEFKQIEKTVSKEMKLMSKQNGKAISKLSGKKAKRVGAVRLPSGFVKPTCISAELAAFLGKENTVLMSRTEVSKEINKYIRTNDLQDKANGRRILADGPLSKLLNFNADEEELTYFNLQRYMKHHFMKLTPAATAAAALALASGVDAAVVEHADEREAAENSVIGEVN